MVAGSFRNSLAPSNDHGGSSSQCVASGKSQCGRGQEVLAVGSVLQEIWQACEERSAQNLVGVGLQDSLSGAETVEPRTGAFDRWSELGT